MKRIEHFFESLLFASRWLLTPFFAGLILAIIVLLVKFMKELTALVTSLFIVSDFNVVVSVLTLVDTTLIAILLVIIIFSGYENFVSRMHISDHEDRPSWMNMISFGDLKIKLIGAVVAISAVELLKAFLLIEHYTTEQVIFKIVIHITFVVSGLLFALSDWIADKDKEKSKAKS